MKIHFITNTNVIFPASICKILDFPPRPLSQKLIKFIQALVTVKYNRLLM